MSSPPPELVEVDTEEDFLQAASLGKLGDLELEFEKAEVELMKRQFELTEPLYKKRHEIAATIPTFWPTILDTYGPEFESFVAPQDTALLNYLKNVDVTRPHPDKEPRDFDISLTFNEKAKEWLEEETLTKCFRWKVVENEWSGIVSDPVKITWKEGKDLTNGETDRAWEKFKQSEKGQDAAAAAGGEEGGADGAGGSSSQDKGKGKAESKKGKSLADRIGGAQPSFFTWFAWRGRVSAGDGEDDDEEEEEDDDLMSHGDELAYTIADDIFPNAVKYFIEALNGEGQSDASDDDDDEEGSGSEMLEVDIDEEDIEEEDEDGGVGGSSNSGIKRVDIELSGSGSESDEDENEARRKRLKR